MANFFYKGITKNGTIVYGAGSGKTKFLFCSNLADQGVDVVWCRINFSWMQKSFSEKDWEPFCYYMSHLIKGGVPLREALEGYLKFCPKNLNQSLQTALNQLVAGKKASVVFQEALRVHPLFVRSLLESAESTGNLADAFYRIGDHFKWIRLLKNKFKSLLRYPFFLFLMMGGILGYLCMFLLPQLESFLHFQNHSLPLSTKILIGLIHGVDHYGLAICIILIGLIFLIRGGYKNQIYRLFIDRYIYRLPFLGFFFKMRDLGIQTEILSNLLGAKVDILRALQVAENQCENLFLKQNMNQILLNLKQGKGLSDSFGRSEMYPSFMVHLIQVGEQTDTLDESFFNARDYFLNQLNDRLAFLSEILQPLLILGLGGVLLWIVLALFFPFYQQIGHIG